MPLYCTTLTPVWSLLWSLARVVRSLVLCGGLSALLLFACPKVMDEATDEQSYSVCSFSLSKWRDCDHEIHADMHALVWFVSETESKVVCCFELAVWDQVISGNKSIHSESYIADAWNVWLCYNVTSFNMLSQHTCTYDLCFCPLLLLSWAFFTAVLEGNCCSFNKLYLNNVTGSALP